MPFPRSGRARQSLSAAAMSALLLASAMKHFRDPGFYRQVVPDYLCLMDPQQQGTGDGGAAAGDGTAPANGTAPAAGTAARSGTAAVDGGPEPLRRQPFAVMAREEWIALSGLLELTAAVGILVPLTRKATATALTAMFTTFLAGHADALRRAYGPQGTPWQRKVHTLRFPLQAPLILWAWTLRKPGAGSWQ
ncbi:DoxX family protein [Arthrobacter sp. Z4-13]